MKATLEAIETSARLNPNIGAIVERIQPSVTSAGYEGSNLPDVEEVVDENIRNVSSELVNRSILIEEMVDSGDLLIVGAPFFVQRLGYGTPVWADEFCEKGRRRCHHPACWTEDGDSASEGPREKRFPPTPVWTEAPRGKQFSPTPA